MITYNIYITAYINMSKLVLPPKTLVKYLINIIANVSYNLFFAGNIVVNQDHYS